MNVQTLQSNQCFWTALVSMSALRICRNGLRSHNQVEEWLKHLFLFYPHSSSSCTFHQLYDESTCELHLLALPSPTKPRQFTTFRFRRQWPSLPLPCRFYMPNGPYLLVNHMMPMPVLKVYFINFNLIKNCI